MLFNIGDLVTRKSYNNDIIFEIQKIEDILDDFLPDLENSKNDKIFDLWVEEGKIYKVKEVK